MTSVDNVKREEHICKRESTELKLSNGEFIFTGPFIFPDVASHNEHTFLSCCLFDKGDVWQTNPRWLIFSVTKRTWCLINSLELIISWVNNERTYPLFAVSVSVRQNPPERNRSTGRFTVTQIQPHWPQILIGTMVNRRSLPGTGGLLKAANGVFYNDHLCWFSR